MKIAKHHSLAGKSVIFASVAALFLLALPVAPAAGIMSMKDPALKEFKILRKQTKREMKRSGKESSAVVIQKLGQAIELLGEEHEISPAGRSRKLIKTSIDDLTRLRRRADFISDKRERQINEAMELAEARLIAHLQKLGRA